MCQLTKKKIRKLLLRYLIKFDEEEKLFSHQNCFNFSLANLSPDLLDCSCANCLKVFNSPR